MRSNDKRRICHLVAPAWLSAISAVPRLVSVLTDITLGTEAR
ncbi:hypothetical protein Ga0080559_TMP1790 [Salipiger profundus]|uniref:Uncharacterized protein n=1 Tax=Salipiger profundus TaxID=1229727 RepID=A0A1U7D3E1_9RHOB|nr:hypothetical protein Ga0080559_TMP1790 [Salipiger profundus]